MANYQCAVRTNYFHVQDPELFRQFMARVYGTEGSVELWEDKDANGRPIFAFGSYGGISGLRDVWEEIWPGDAMLSGRQRRDHHPQRI